MNVENDFLFYIMNQSIAWVTLLVDNYDKAIEFYTKKLQFILVEDTKLSDDKRWVLVSPKGNKGCMLLLAKASDDEQRSRIGNQTGGRVSLFLHTDNFNDDYKNLIAKNVSIVREPVKAPYGTVAVFEDLYGNRWDLLQPASDKTFH